MDINNPVLLRGIERFLIIFGAIVFGFLGYKLYRLGISQGYSKLNVKSSFLRFALSGSGPGLFFMALGALTLIIALIQGGGSKKTQTNSFELSELEPSRILSNTSDQQQLRELENKIYNQIFQLLKENKLHETSRRDSIGVISQQQFDELERKLLIKIQSKSEEKILNMMMMNDYQLEASLKYQYDDIIALVDSISLRLAKLEILCEN